MKRANLVLTLVGVTALCVATASAADPCPANVLCVDGQPCESLTAVSAYRQSNYDGNATSSVLYNWSTASVSADAQLAFLSSRPIKSSIEANEDFVVTGIPPGTPLTVHARIRVRANAYTSNGASHSTGWLEKVGVGHVEVAANADHPSNVDIDQVLALDFPGLAGETFRLTMGGRSDANSGTTYVIVRLTFVDLPAGASVSTCHSNPPVPATSLSWGSIKSRYR